MKKILVSTLIAIMIGATLTGCGNNESKDEKPQTEQNGGETQTSNVSAKEVVDKLVEKEYVPMPMVIDSDMAADVYHLNLDDVEDFGIVQTGRSPGIGFIMVVKAKDGKVDAVKSAVDQVLQDKVNEAFYPEEKEVAESAKVEVNGDIVSLLIFDPQVADEATAEFNELIK